MEHDPKSIYRRGADNGLIFGLYFCLMFASMVIAENLTWVSAITTLMMFGVPTLVYIFLRKTFVSHHGFPRFSMLWMQGIVGFACGSLILSVFVYIYIRLIDPQYVPRQIDMLISTYEGIDNQRSIELVDLLKNIRHYRLYPTPRDIIVQIILMAVFSGSIISMLMSLLVKMKPVKNIN